MDGWTEGGRNGWIDGWVDGRTDRRTEGWVDGWMDGWMEGEEGMDGWMCDCVHRFFTLFQMECECNGNGMLVQLADLGWMVKHAREKASV